MSAVSARQAAAVISAARARRHDSGAARWRRAPCHPSAGMHKLPKLEAAPTLGDCDGSERCHSGVCYWLSAAISVRWAARESAALATFGHDREEIRRPACLIECVPAAKRKARGDKFS